MEILRLMAILLLIILVIAIGSKVVYKDNFTILEGSVVLDAVPSDYEYGTQKQTVWTLDFPTGYNKDNCVCIAFGGRFYKDRGYSYARGEEYSSVNMINGDIPRTIQLGTQSDLRKIWCQAYNMANQSRIFYYKIVLMKI